jgi:hypothetical protein
MVAYDILATSPNQPSADANISVKILTLYDDGTMVASPDLFSQIIPDMAPILDISVAQLNGSGVLVAVAARSKLLTFPLNVSSGVAGSFTTVTAPTSWGVSQNEQGPMDVGFIEVDVKQVSQGLVHVSTVARRTEVCATYASKATCPTAENMNIGRYWEHGRCSWYEVQYSPSPNMRHNGGMCVADSQGVQDLRYYVTSQLVELTTCRDVSECVGMQVNALPSERRLGSFMRNYEPELEATRNYIVYESNALADLGGQVTSLQTAVLTNTSVVIKWTELRALFMGRHIDPSFSATNFLRLDLNMEGTCNDASFTDRWGKSCEDWASIVAQGEKNCSFYPFRLERGEIYEKADLAQVREHCPKACGYPCGACTDVGNACMFPFVFDDAVYHTCTNNQSDLSDEDFDGRTDDGAAWCATAFSRQPPHSLLPQGGFLNTWGACAPCAWQQRNYSTTIAGLTSDYLPLNGILVAAPFLGVGADINYLAGAHIYIRVQDLNSTTSGPESEQT